MDKNRLISYDELIENFISLLDVVQDEEKENEKENKKWVWF